MPVGSVAGEDAPILSSGSGFDPSAIRLENLDRRIQKILAGYRVPFVPSPHREDKCYFWLAATGLGIMLSTVILYTGLYLWMPPSIMFLSAMIVHLAFIWWLTGLYVRQFKVRKLWPTIPVIYGSSSIGPFSLVGLVLCFSVPSLGDRFLLLLMLFVIFAFGIFSARPTYISIHFPYSEKTGERLRGFFLKRYCKIDPHSFDPQRFGLAEILAAPLTRWRSNSGKLWLFFDHVADGDHRIVVKVILRKSWITSLTRYKTLTLPATLQQMIVLAERFGSVRQMSSIMPYY